MHERLDDLETKFAFQEETINELREAVTAHQQQLLQMSREVEIMRAQLATFASSLGKLDEETAGEEPPPPHY